MNEPESGVADAAPDGPSVFRDTGPRSDAPTADAPSADAGLPDRARADGPVADAGACGDKLQNGTETDVDCGGASCGPCDEQRKCVAPRDCKSGSCTGGRCDGVLEVASGVSRTFEDLSTAGQVTGISGAQLTLAPASGFAAGQEALLINLQGSATDVTSVGNWELVEVASVSGAVVTLKAAVAKSYGKASANADLTGQKVFLVRVPRYASVTIKGELTAKAWNGTVGGLGLIVLRATGKLVVDAAGKLTLGARGYRSLGVNCNGVTGVPGESAFPMLPYSCPWTTTPTKAPNGGGGGGGLSNCNVYSCATQQLGAGGGGASYGGAGQDGQHNGTQQQGGLAGLVYGQPALSQVYLGAGGGAGAGGTNGPGTIVANGRGGGLLLLFADELAIDGATDASGQVGGDNANCGSANGSGSGGGGAGGSVYLAARTVKITAGKITAKGGPGGCKGGGAGGVGRIRIGCTTLNGTACPGADANLTTPPAYLVGP
ncbi:MAG: hypothetical protein IT371_27575 [Deltaproteobacteria bacterium]|nr:hypothetical protein [Deltaproteobacteria bacterium]